ncbi:unnamed protein product [Mycena citricolor]|uniref:Uncharacterized protein n=1 Tax=Mycena citricolor TaxID=2018698 RepID=A0AAD2GUW4_9AGAR|nr:unnamed protein product [Mycena citricolor]
MFARRLITILCAFTIFRTPSPSEDIGEDLPDLASAPDLERALFALVSEGQMINSMISAVYAREEDREQAPLVPKAKAEASFVALAKQHGMKEERAQWHWDRFWTLVKMLFRISSCWAKDFPEQSVRVVLKFLGFGVKGPMKGTSTVSPTTLAAYSMTGSFASWA